MEPSTIVASTAIFISRFSSGHTYLRVQGDRDFNDQCYHESLDFQPGSHLSDAVDAAARLLVGWAEIGDLGMALAAEHVREEGLAE
jgi:hypothetical protein